MTKKNRLNSIIGHYSDGKPTVFAKYLGVAPSTISSWLSRDTLDYDLLFAKCENISPEWLLTGEGKMLKESGVDRELYLDEQNKEIIATQSNNHIGIPLIPIDAMAGFGTGTGDSIMAYDCDHYVIPNMQNADFLITVRGESMEPKYLPGDIVACKKLSLSAFFQWNKVYVLDTEQGALIKCINESDKKNCVKCVSVNESFAPFDLPLEEIHSLALVVGMIRVE